MATTGGEFRMQRTAQRSVVVPQRDVGRRRVVALLDAARDVFAEKGFAAATMAEIAARAGAQIGSLYRFFPNKEAVGEALLERVRQNAEATFDELDAALGSLSTQELADWLLSVNVRLKEDKQAFVALMEAHEEWSQQRLELRRLLLERVARTLLSYCPALTLKAARDMAPVVYHNMRSMALTYGPAGADPRAGSRAELSQMIGLYLAHRFAAARRAAKNVQRD
jgi:AcrR family transcriptional regulator